MKRILLAIGLILLCWMAMPQPAKAYDLFKGVDCTNGPAANSTVCQSSEKNRSIYGPNGVLIKITNLIAYIAGAAAIIIIIVGAIRFVTSGSDTSVGSRIDDDVLNAKRSISYAAVGLVIIVLAKVLITYVVTKLH